MSEITVISKTQKIVVDPASSAVAVISAGPIGPGGSADFELLPQGTLAYAELTTTPTNLATSSTLIAGLTVTVAGMDAARKYKVEARVSATSTVVADVIRYTLQEGANGIDLAQERVEAAGLYYGPLVMSKFYSAGGLSGSHTFAVYGYRFSGTGTCTAPCLAAYPIWIRVTDEGAV